MTADAHPVALTSEQCQRLSDTLTRPLLLAAKAPGVIIRLQPDTVITSLVATLNNAGIRIAGARLEGSAATACMVAKECFYVRCALPCALLLGFPPPRLH
jgi:hypothetical protein